MLGLISEKNAQPSGLCPSFATCLSFIPLSLFFNRPLHAAQQLLARYLPNWGMATVSIGLTVPVVITFMSLTARGACRPSRPNPPHGCTGTPPRLALAHPRCVPKSGPGSDRGRTQLLARSLPNWETAIVSIGLTVPVVIIFMSLLVRSTSRRTQLHAQ